METTTEAEDEAGIRSIFHCGDQMLIERIIPPCPEKLPWRRDGNLWRIGRFELTRVMDGMFRLTWPRGSIDGGKDVISAAVRNHWGEGV